MTLSNETLERMNGLVTISTVDSIHDSIIDIKYDLINDGFEPEEADAYILHKVTISLNFSL